MHKSQQTHTVAAKTHKSKLSLLLLLVSVKNVSKNEITFRQKEDSRNLDAKATKGIWDISVCWKHGL